jgi:anti-sigma regulatory factor (Ser/Thr protein kinase)
MSGVSTNEATEIVTDTLDSRSLDLLSTTINGQELRLSLPSNRRVIVPVIELLRGVAEAVGVLSEKEQMPMSIALEEALNNAVVHGNLEVSSELRDREDDSFENMIEIRLHRKPYRERRVDVTAKFSDSEVRVTICDEGPGFDVSAVPDPTTEENICLNHGRGLFLMRSFMDEVQHNATGNQVTLVKRKNLA